MENILKLMKSFEKKNNMSISILINSDGSSHIEEFWEGEVLKRVNNQDELFNFLTDIEYEKDHNGLCYSPVRIKSK